VRKRRTIDDRPLYARAAGAGGAMVLRLWTHATRRPVDFVAAFLAAVVSLIIVVNAAFMQSGSLPAPFFVAPKPSQAAATDAPKPADTSPPIRQILAPMAPQPVVARRNDPIASLIAQSPRIAAVQRVLSEYGYGQLKPSGILDDATSKAIEKFERERKLPITGRVTDRLVAELAGVTGRPIE